MAIEAIKKLSRAFVEKYKDDEGFQSILEHLDNGTDPFVIIEQLYDLQEMLTDQIIERDRQDQLLK